MSESKKDLVRDKIIDFVDNVLELAQKQNKLDYVEIVITNHNGTLQTDYKLRDRKKAY